MNIRLFQVLAGGLDVGFGCESGQAFVVDEYPQRVATGQQHVDAKVKLEPVNKVRPVNITLNYARLIVVSYGIESTRQKDSLALARRLRLDDVRC